MTITQQSPGPMATSPSCPSWCVLCLADSEHAEDRMHYGLERTVTLEIEQGLHPDNPRMVVFLAECVGDRSPHVQLCRNEEPAVQLTLAEAEALAKQLLRVCGEVSA